MDKMIEGVQKSKENPYVLELQQVKPEFTTKDKDSGTHDTLQTVNQNVSTSAPYTKLSSENECEQINGFMAANKGIPKKRLRFIAVLTSLLFIVAAMAVLFFLVLSSRENGPENIQNDATAVKARACINYTTGIPNGKIVDFTGSNHGDTFKIECHNGNKIEGHKIVTCLSSNNWSEIPRCVPQLCDTFAPPEHAILIPRNVDRQIGSEVLIICKEGFVLKGKNIVLCQKNETWTEIPTCASIACNYPTHIENGILTGMKGLTYNSSFSVVCTVGHELVGSSTVTCKSDGQWSDFPSCMPISCGIPQIPANGHLTYIGGTSLGSKAMLSCKETFFLQGSSEINCTIHGNWTQMPKCSAKAEECSTFPDVENGDVNGPNRSISSTIYEATYSVTCHRGFILTGNSSVTCSTGKWSTIPSCKPVTCESPHAPNNGFIQSTNGSTFMASTVIGCNKGYTLNGKAQLTCLVSGEWSSNPTCEPKDCGIPHIVTNGEIKNLLSTKYNYSFSVHCKDGYILIGPQTVKCTANGKWSSLPSCVNETDCGTPPNIPNGNIAGQTNTDSGLSVICNEGYTLNGTGVIQCDYNGKWQNIPTCTKLLVPCGSPKIPTNGALESVQGTSSNKTASFKCDPGFMLRGKNIAFCVENGNWSKVPTCVPDCGVPPNVVDGSLNKVNDSQTFSVKCNGGYILTGEETVTCEADGQWSDLPTCDPVSCGIPKISQNQMLVYINGTTFNAVAKIRCVDGFQLSKNSEIRCLGNGSWTWVPECTLIDCGIPSILHGSIEGVINTIYGSTLTINCNVGYFLIGAPSIHCGKDGTWSQLPTCKQIQCGLPNIPANGAIERIQGTTFNKTAVIICNSGFALNGSNTVYCLNNGTWSNGPTCIPDCGIPSNVSNGEIRGLENTKYNNTFTVKCNDGYILTGQETVRCGNDGRWSVIPACITQTDCGVPPDIPNGVIREQSSQNGINKFIVNCNSGYVLNGDSTVICDFLSAWSELPTCKVLSCGLPDIPMNRKLVTLNGTNLNDVANLKCDEGFILEGSSVITCLSNGSWSLIGPCEEIDCGTPNVSHGSIKGFTDAGYMSTFSATCDEDYSLVGSGVVQCGIDGKWTDIPTCELIPCGLPDIPANGAIDKINGTTGRKTAFIVCHPGFIMNGTNFIQCFSHGIWTKSPTCIPVSDCFDVFQDSNKSVSGVYNVILWRSKVYCDMDTDGGGWTVFQYRYDGSVDFYRNYSAYENGFGTLNGEFWLGLKYISEIALQGDTTLRIDLTAKDGSTAYDKFENFYLKKSFFYQLNLGTRSGNAGSSSYNLQYNNGATFSTYKGYHTSVCARICHGGWWYQSCTYANLNGEYLEPGTNITKNSKTNGFVYLSFKPNESLKMSKLMVRREQVCPNSPCDIKYVPPVR